MFNCDWAQDLTRYDCQTLRALDGGPCLEIGTPFSLPDGSAINLYITQAANGMVKISDNADTLFQLDGLGLDVWQAARLFSIREVMKKHRMAALEIRWQRPRQYRHRDNRPQHGHSVVVRSCCRERSVRSRRGLSDATATLRYHRRSVIRQARSAIFWCAFSRRVLEDA